MYEPKVQKRYPLSKIETCGKCYNFQIDILAVVIEIWRCQYDTHLGVNVLAIIGQRLACTDGDMVRDSTMQSNNKVASQL